jgi:hypothetical protein
VPIWKRCPFAWRRVRHGGGRAVASAAAALLAAVFGFFVTTLVAVVGNVALPSIPSDQRPNPGV